MAELGAGIVQMVRVLALTLVNTPLLGALIKAQLALSAAALLIAVLKPTARARYRMRALSVAAFPLLLLVALLSLEPLLLPVSGINNSAPSAPNAGERLFGEYGRRATELALPAHDGRRAGEFGLKPTGPPPTLDAAAFATRLLNRALRALLLAGVAYAAGALFLAMHMITRLRRRGRKRQDLSAMASDAWKQSVEVVETEGVRFPAAGGLLRPTIFLPTALAREASDRSGVEVAIQHELEHLRRRDHLSTPALWAIVRLFWFLPHLRGVVRRIELDRELIVDEACTRAGAAESTDPRPLEYGRALLRAIEVCAAPRAATPRISAAETGGFVQMHGGSVAALRLRIESLAKVVGGTTPEEKGMRKRRANVVAGVVLALLLASTGVARLVADEGALPSPGGESAERVQPTVGWPLLANLGLVTMEFGENIHPSTGEPYLHRGVDFAVWVGTPVLTAGRGRVAAVLDHEAYGRAVFVDHGDHFVTFYGHLRAVDVRPGDQVAAGDPLGSAGNTGFTTASGEMGVLHFGAGYLAGSEYRPELVDWVEPIFAISGRGSLSHGGTVSTP